MVRRQHLLWISTLLLLLGGLLWAFWSGKAHEPLDRRVQAGIIRQMAEQPSSWRGWDLLHAPDPGWTDPRRTERPVQPVPQPLFPPEPFFLVDGSRKLTPQEAAREAVRGMLHYIKANDAGEGYKLLEFQVEEPRLLGREEIVQRALKRCGTPELNRWTREQLQVWCQGFFQRYPGLSEDMWMVEPAFSVKWMGEIAGLPYETCVNSGMADRDGLVDLPAVFRNPARHSPLLLIRQGNQYRLQHAEAFFAEYENREENGRSHLTEQTERT